MSIRTKREWTAMLLQLLILAICLVKWSSANGPAGINERPIVTTGLGKIKGNVLESRLGALFYSFRNVPYAKPPVGNLRFKPPEPIDQWNGVLNATADGPMCPQPSYNLTDWDISEDCLRLNVYTRDLSSSNRRPVIVYIHPGGFYSTSGQSRHFAGPQNFMDQDIVLVTFNYRLGTLGFLSTGTEQAPGNNGFKDQVAALKWVRLHISKFGGDPNSVTIMGYSVGAMSVTLHMVSPMSRGLFHRAIAMSGAATAQWEIPNDQMDLAKQQAGLLGCPDDNVELILQCLKSKDAKEIGETYDLMFKFQNNPILVWKPVIEQDFGQERFLTENPTKLFRQGRFARVPVMTGITKYEFLGPAINILKSTKARADLDTNFINIAPICFLYENGTERSRNISTNLRKNFLNASIVDNRSLTGLNNLFNDGVIGFGVHRFARLAHRYTKVYYYQNSYVGRFSHTYYPDDKPYGTVHHDDLLYLFVVPSVAPMFKQTDPENLTVERMTRMWASFADKGDPIKLTDDQLRDIRWRQMLVNRLNYLDIGDELVMKDGLNMGRYSVWNNLFPLTGRRGGRYSTMSDNDELYDDNKMEQSTNK